MEINKVVRRKKIFFLSLFLTHLTFLWPVAMNAQDGALSKDSLEAEAVFTDGLRWSEKEQLDSALVSFKKAADRFAEIELWQRWYDSQQESCYSLYYLGKYDEIIDYLQYGMDNILPKANDPVLSSRINGWFGFIYFYKGIYNKALDYYLIQTKTLEDAGNPNGLQGNLTNIGIIYTMQGDYNHALIYLEKAEKYYLENLDERTLQKVYWNMGKAHWAKGNFPMAIDSYQKYLNYGGDEAEAFFVLGEVYRDMGELKTAMNFVEKALGEYKQKQLNVSQLLVVKGSIYHLQNRNGKAIECYQQALSSMDEAEFISNRDLGQFYIRFGNAYVATKQFLLALDQYQKALNIFIPSFDESNNSINPSLEIIDIANCIWIMEALVAKGNVFQKLYAKEHNSAYLQDALSCYELAFKSIDILRYNHTEEASKISLIDYAHPIYEQALKTTSILYKITGEEKYLNQAFAFSQRTKGFLLATALQNINAQEKGGIPDTLIQKEGALKASILELNPKILTLKNQTNSTSDSLQLANLEANRFEAKRDLQKLLDHLEQNYPQYYQLKYENKVASIQDIQENILNKNTALIDYFLGDSSLFILTITKDKVDLQELDRTENLDEFLDQFIFQVGNFDFVAGAEKAYQEFTESAYFLFQKLLEKPLAGAGQHINQLLIIPDGILNTLPFEALLTSLPERNQVNYSFSNLSYLLEEYIVSYHYAPQILLEQKNKKQDKNASKLFAGFAPDFSKNKLTSRIRDCSESELSNLEYNRIEVEKISLQINGESFLNTNATVDAFKSKAKRLPHFTFGYSCLYERGGSFKA